MKIKNLRFERYPNCKIKDKLQKKNEKQNQYV